jgi:ketosteroid isomerase-like protein
MTHSHDASDPALAFVAAVNAREFDLLDRTYAEDAVLVPAPGQPMTGADRVAASQRLLSFGLPMDATVRHLYVAGDIALLIVDWSMRGTTPDGYDIDLSGTATDVVRRDQYGHWKYVIDNPFGTA